MVNNKHAKNVQTQWQRTTSKTNQTILLPPVMLIKVISLQVCQGWEGWALSHCRGEVETGVTFLEDTLSVCNKSLRTLWAGESSRKFSRGKNHGCCKGILAEHTVGREIFYCNKIKASSLPYSQRFLVKLRINPILDPVAWSYSLSRFLSPSFSPCLSSFSFSDLPGLVQPQDFCTGCYLCLGCLFPSNASPMRALCYSPLDPWPAP